MGKKKCTVCGAPSTGQKCFRHKERKPLRKQKIRRGTIIEKRAGTSTKSVRTLKNILWGYVSKVIRLRDSDELGIGKCITCDNLEYWKYADAGHCRPRKHNMTFADERNVNLQCKTCNQIKGGLEEKHGEEIDKKWGEGTYEELKCLSRQNKRWTPWELEELIEKFTAEYLRLIKTKKKYEDGAV